MRLGRVSPTLILILAPAFACAGAASPATAPADLSPSEAFAAYQQGQERVVRFLEDRVRRDPADIIALNRLAGVYLQKMRESGSIDYILLARKKADQSLAVSGAEQNTDGLGMLGRVKFESHQFTEARDIGLQLTALAPEKVGPYALLGDALLELGDYEQASAAYGKMRQLDEDAFNVLSRLARLSLLRGDPDAAVSQLSLALKRAQESPEAIAWCRWQLGEVFFSTGDYPNAERQYLQALHDFPGYFRALGSLGRVRAARGDLPAAISSYEKAVGIFPDPTFVAVLGDLYQLQGREREAHQQYDLVRKIAKLSTFYGVLYNRTYALFCADHDLIADSAYAEALREFGVRKDIYGADTVAWTALRAGKLPEAQAAIKQAQRLGTRDARLWYHRGMIELACGNRALAIEWLAKAQALNPVFDPLQARKCAKALTEAREPIPHR